MELGPSPRKNFPLKNSPAGFSGEKPPREIPKEFPEPNLGNLTDSTRNGGGVFATLRRCATKNGTYSYLLILIHSYSSISDSSLVSPKRPREIQRISGTKVLEIAPQFLRGLRQGLRGSLFGNRRLLFCAILFLFVPFRDLLIPFCPFLSLLLPFRTRFQAENEGAVSRDSQLVTRKYLAMKGLRRS
jgi:hypothetical protein